MEYVEEVKAHSIYDEVLIKALEDNLAIVRFDTNKRVTYVNDNFAQALKYRKEDVLGKEHKSFCFPDFYNSPDYVELWNNLLNGVSFQDKIMRKNAYGEVIWLEATYFPIYDALGNRVIGVSKVATDITERQLKIEAVTQDLLELSKSMAVSSRNGISKGEDLLEKSKAMIRESNDSTENLSELLKKNESVKSIVKTIQDIASKTNLLALNASIEAARSGKYGLGFGVIAEEVKRLSKQVHESAENIKLDIQAVTNNIDLVVDGNTHLKEHIEQSEKEIHVAISEFNGIAVESDKISRQADELDTII